MKNGTLPWVTDSTYHVLVRQFKAKELFKIVLTASDLGHYLIIWDVAANYLLENKSEIDKIIDLEN